MKQGDYQHLAVVINRLLRVTPPAAVQARREYFETGMVGKLRMSHESAAFLPRFHQRQVGLLGDFG